MKNFSCSCGQTLFFENTRCLACASKVGFNPSDFSMYPVASNGSVLIQGEAHTLCRNSTDYDICNWLVVGTGPGYCISCELNHTIPNLMAENRRRWWKSLEHAKRRLIYSLLSLKLPIIGKHIDARGLAFEFIEDKRTNPEVFEDHVNTGHDNGLITINIAEADHVSREITRQYTGELYRTLLGHFRHESGHYYFSYLVCTDPLKQQFRELFGDERADYGSALSDYYVNKSTMIRDPDLISHYAQAHPLEDWAEVWSHYLHMVDTLETAAEYAMQQGSTHLDDIDELLIKWSELSIMLNSLNRSMGLEDAYPFTLSELTLKKLRFVHGLLYPS
ncbi:MAG: putative zinc-binding metallopeptidase [Gammaproteobacteria bacterium]|nr:putative zinc-binding metallopeptidase [Gammaproteobacteria bacterium]MDD9958996.1 putative zinc-binding metallopeptidase [Gammaproteobacteria bacterium]